LLAAPSKKVSILVNGRKLIVLLLGTSDDVVFNNDIFNILTASRKPQYHMWNIYVMLLVLRSLSFTNFSVHVEETGDRLGIMLTLVLALIAFKLVLAQQLPSISFLTIIDVYILGSMLLMFFISVFTSLMPSLGLQHNTLLLADKVIMIIGAILWALMNLWFLWNIDRLSKRRKVEIRDIKKKFQ
jgi:hypothetical protein